MSHNARNFSDDPIVQANVTEAEYINSYRAKRAEKAFVQHSPLLAVLKQTTRLKGSEMEFLYKLSNAATVSAGYVHCASTAGKSKKLILKSKKLYAFTDVDGETMKIFKNDKESVIASFSERFLEDPEQAFNFNLERQIMTNDITGSGLLDVVTAVSGAGTKVSPYIVELAVDTIEAKYEEGMVLHINDDGIEGSDKKGALTVRIEEVVPVDGATPLKLHLVGNPSVAVAIADKLYMASSKGNEVTGLRGLIDAVVGDTVYGATMTRQMVSTKKDLTGSAISVQVVRDMLTKIRKKSGQTPDLIMTSDEIYRDLEQLTEGSKTFFIPWNSGTKAGVVKLGFNGVEIAIAGKTVRVVATDMIKKGDVLFLNTKEMELMWRSKPTWDDTDGTVFRTETCDDSFSARYKGYGEFMANAGYFGLITNATTTDLLG